MNIQHQLQDYFSTLQVVNTHCHHLRDDFFTDVTLHDILSASYTSWIAPPFTDSPEDISRLFQTMSVNSYTYWMTDAVGRLYLEGERLTQTNYPLADQVLRERYRIDPRHHIALLTDVCNYQTVILDDYHHPGSNHQLAFVRPTFRCDMFLFGGRREGQDQNGNRPGAYLSGSPQNLQEYLDEIGLAIDCKMAENGCRSLKLAIAYERGLDFTAFDWNKAEAAFQGSDTPEDRKAFQDVVVDSLCTLAAERNIPFQIHTGLGQLYHTNALWLASLITRHPKTSFVLFHASYPWMEDVLALAHNHRNVYPDLCWLPLLSTAAAERFLSEALDLLDAGRLTWGCDTWTGEESYGALLSIRFVLSKVLARKVTEGFYSMTYAKELGTRILAGNAKELYRL